MRNDIKLIPLNDAVGINNITTGDITHDMSTLARALRRTGQTALADEISGWIDPLRNAAEQIAASYMQDLNAQVSYSESMTHGLVTAVIAGIDMGKRELVS